MCFIQTVLYIVLIEQSILASTEKKNYTNECMLTRAIPTNVIFINFII